MTYLEEALIMAHPTSDPGFRAPHGPGQSLDRCAVSPSPGYKSVRGQSFCVLLTPLAYIPVGEPAPARFPSPRE